VKLVDVQMEDQWGKQPTSPWKAEKSIQLKKRPKIHEEYCAGFEGVELIMVIEYKCRMVECVQVGARNYYGKWSSEVITTMTLYQVYM